VDGKLFLGTARFLQSSGSGEAAYRSVVSRAYYACFLEARQVAFGQCSEAARTRAGISKEGAIRHQPLQWYLKGSSSMNIRQLGEDLASLHGNRQDADYNMTKSLTSGDSRAAIEDAEAFLQAFSRVSPAEIGDAMTEYINRIHA
jgi:uncharacterized protein (UPF0332 family)